jgi:3-hydroxybutyryl-CoA dehydratase
MELGDTYESKFFVNQDDVIKFAEVTGDNNPIHLDDEIASKSIFKKKIVHGFLAGSVFSRVFGTEWPGTGTLYLKQEMKFLAPVFTDNLYIAKFKVEEIKDKNRAIISTRLEDEKSKNLVILGEAVVIFT